MSCFPWIFESYAIHTPCGSWRSNGSRQLARSPSLPWRWKQQPRRASVRADRVWEIRWLLDWLQRDPWGLCENGRFTLWLWLTLAMEAMAHWNRWFTGLPNLIAWWIFPWQTVSHNQRVFAKSLTKKLTYVFCCCENMRKWYGDFCFD